MNYNTFNSTTTNFNSTNNIEDYINMLFPYNHHSSLSFNPSSIIPNHHHHHLDHHHHNHLDHHHHQQQLLQSSQFEFDSDLALFTSLLPQNNIGLEDDVFPLNNTLIEEQSLDQASETITHIEDSQRISISQAPKMKKLNSNKRNRTDKHSKIKTAKGTRDRRMRLSLDVATKLFGLQDMLGFDKASKTVEWLLTQAKPEIIKIATSLSHQLNHGERSGCFTSDDESQKRSKGTLGSKGTSLCEIASFLTEEHGDNSINTTGDKVDGRSLRRKRKSLQPRTLILKKLSKEERAKARERAKDRTKEKMMLKKRSQVNVVGEFHEILKNNKSDLNSNWNKEIQESYYKNDRFAICEEIEMNQEHHRISDESYDLINRLNSSFCHRSQGAATSIELQNQFMLNQPRDRMYNSQNMC